MNLRQLINVAYMAIIEHMPQKERAKLDMDLASPPKTGMLYLPNQRTTVKSFGDERLRALMGSNMFGPAAGAKR